MSKAGAVLLILGVLLALMALGCDEVPTQVPGSDGSSSSFDAVSCGPGTKLCDSKCTNLLRDNLHCGQCNNSCPAGQACAAGKCVTTCPAGQVACSGTCVTLQSDGEHCGACDNACKSGEICVKGKCAANCPDGYAECSSKCVKTLIDKNNCGACGQQCKPGEVCVKGKCADNCQDGYTNCSGICVKTATDSSNCGTCGKLCAVGMACVAGACVLKCPTGLSTCAKACASTQSDPQNCGACGNLCKAGEVCTAGKCVLNCSPGYSDCKGVCTQLLADGKNCGTCGAACKATEICSAGKCLLNCPPGHSPCGGQCFNTKADPNNCGICGKKCAAALVCSNSKCSVTCMTGYEDCNRSCSSLKTDPANCGKCGNACVAGQTCKNGACVAIQCDVFTYGPSARAVDIVFIVDQSSSMAEEIAGIQANLNKFSAFITATKLDYHVLLLARRGVTGYDICIKPPLGATGCMDNTRFKQISIDIDSYNSLSKFKQYVGPLEGFMRKGSLRHIIEISDDNAKFLATSFHGWLTARAGWKDYLFHSVVVTKQDVCSIDIGKEYLQLSGLTKGFVSHICSAKWTDLFNQLGKAVTGKALKQYKPTKKPVVSSLEVYYDSQLKQSTKDWTWDTANEVMVIQGTPPPLGTKIMVCYLVK